VTVEQRLDRAARELLAAIPPDPPAPLDRPSTPLGRRRRRVASSVAALVAVIALVVVVVVIADASGRGRATPAAATGCPTTFVLPFVPSYLPAGWKPVTRHVAHASKGTNAIEVWSGTNPGASIYGVIEVWRGAGADSVPTPSPVQIVTVLGRAAQFGPISDGSSVTFATGDPDNPCDQWALVGHPGVTAQILLEVAEHLRSVA
jgi:hypothetical protein